MAHATPRWNVLQHGPLEQLTERLWRVEGAVPGMSLRRVMTVAKRQQGGLIVHSAIALGEPEMQQLEALGSLEVLLVPSAVHRLDAPAYKQRYPQLQVFAPRAARDKVAQVVALDGSYEDFVSDEAVQLHELPGTRGREGALLVHSSDGLTIVLNDVLMNMDPRPDFLGWLFTTLLGSAPGPRVSRLAKLALVADRKALRAEFERLAALPELARLIVSHDKVSAPGAEARAALLQAATYL
jgi:hypothetical protein